MKTPSIRIPSFATHCEQELNVEARNKFAEKLCISLQEDLDTEIFSMVDALTISMLMGEGWIKQDDLWEDPMDHKKYPLDEAGFIQRDRNDVASIMME